MRAPRSVIKHPTKGYFTELVAIGQEAVLAQADLALESGVKVTKGQVLGYTPIFKARFGGQMGNCSKFDTEGDANNLLSGDYAVHFTGCTVEPELDAVEAAAAEA